MGRGATSYYTKSRKDLPTYLIPPSPMCRWKSYRNTAGATPSKKTYNYRFDSSQHNVRKHMSVASTYNMYIALHVYQYLFFSQYQIMMLGVGLRAYNNIIILCCDVLMYSKRARPSCGNELYRPIIFIIYSDARCLPTCPSFSRV